MSNSGSPLAFGVSAAFSIHDGDATGKYVTFVSGLVVTSVVVEGTGTAFTATIPVGIEGQSYVFLTNANVTGGPGSLTDAVILNGPAIIEVTPASPNYDPSYK